MADRNYAAPSKYMQPTHKIGRTKQILYTALLLIVLTGGATASAMVNMATPVLLAAILITGIICTYGASTRQRWGGLGLQVVTGVVVAATTVSGILDGLWAAAVLGVGAVAWFVVRTGRNYMRQAATIPGSLRNMVERYITLSEESISGVQLGVRTDDGAVFGIIYAGEVARKPGDSKQVQKAVQGAKSARDILAGKGSLEVNLIAVAGGSFATETIDGIVVCDGEHFGKTVATVQAPSRETLVESAKAAGVQINRNQTRRVGKRQGGSGKKIVHQGRITKVEQ